MPSQEATPNNTINGLLTAALFSLIGWNLYTTHSLDVKVKGIEVSLGYISKEIRDRQDR